jgi:hypothetical protein
MAIESNVVSRYHPFINVESFVDCKDEPICEHINKAFSVHDNRHKKIYFIPSKKILNECVCGKDDTWELSDFISKGQYGSVSLAKCKSFNGDLKDIKYAFKIIVSDNESAEDFFINEVNIQQYSYEKTGTTTPIYQVFIGRSSDNQNKIFMFVTDLLYESIDSHVTKLLEQNAQEGKSLPSDIIDKLALYSKKCRDICIELYKNDICHNDSHFGNFMFTDDKYDTIKIIDFGESTQSKYCNKNMLHYKDIGTFEDLLRYHNKYNFNFNDIFEIYYKARIPSGILFFVSTKWNDGKTNRDIWKVILPYIDKKYWDMVLTEMRVHDHNFFYIKDIDSILLNPEIRYEASFTERYKKDLEEFINNIPLKIIVQDIKDPYWSHGRTTKYQEKLF